MAPLTTVTSGGILDGTIVNADVNASAAIAGTKITPEFGSQAITTSGTLASGAATVTGDFHATGNVLFGNSSGGGNERAVF